MKMQYIDRAFSEASRTAIQQANEIIDEYQAQGFKLTLRQLYYQFVSRDLIPNTMRSYKRIGNILNDGRLAGLIDWDAIEDRTRNLQKLSHWSDPSSIMDSCAYSYREDTWATQPVRIEVWIEKEALAGVFQPVCEELRVPFFCCRGYTSQSEMHTAAGRLCAYRDRGQTPLILHFGDHDPSGIDMTRDIVDRMETFGLALSLHRLALNMDQVEQYNPPPNYAKMTDSRFAGYVEAYGRESWELDALEPRALADLVRTSVTSAQNADAWAAAIDQEDDRKETLTECASRWGEVAEFLAS